MKNLKENILTHIDISLSQKDSMGRFSGNRSQIIRFICKLSKMERTFHIICHFY